MNKFMNEQLDSSTQLLKSINNEQLFMCSILIIDATNMCNMLIIVKL